MFRKSISLVICVTFLFSLITPVPTVQAQPLLGLPEPGSMVNLSPVYEPAIIKGITVHKDNPFLFDFIVDVGQDHLQGEALKKEGEKLIKYFLASLAIPEKDLWVNLSPYEKDRIVPRALGQTEMGRDLLAQDYMLKQITASLIYPEKQLGKAFWDKVYVKAQEMYGTTQVPVNTFNKVWIMADRAEVFEHNQTAFVIDSHLKVMLEEDYLALNKQTNKQTNPSLALSRVQQYNSHTLNSQIIREVIIPELEKEVNKGKNFANLRQIFNSLILAGWYKNNLKQALLNQVYTGKEKVKGIDLQDRTIGEKIYQRYLKAYKKGVFNFVKEDVSTGTTVPRKYFSGGIVDSAMVENPTVTQDPGSLEFAMRGEDNRLAVFNTGFNLSNSPAHTTDAAMAGTQRPRTSEFPKKEIIFTIDHLMAVLNGKEGRSEGNHYYLERKSDYTFYIMRQLRQSERFQIAFVIDMGKEIDLLIRNPVVVIDLLPRLREKVIGLQPNQNNMITAENFSNATEDILFQQISIPESTVKLKERRDRSPRTTSNQRVVSATTTEEVIITLEHTIAAFEGDAQRHSVQFESPLPASYLVLHQLQMVSRFGITNATLNADGIIQLNVQNSILGRLENLKTAVESFNSERISNAALVQLSGEVIHSEAIAAREAARSAAEEETVKRRAAEAEAASQTELARRALAARRAEEARQAEEIAQQAAAVSAEKPSEVNTIGFLDGPEAEIKFEPETEAQPPASILLEPSPKAPKPASFDISIMNLKRAKEFVGHMLTNAMRFQPNASVLSVAAAAYIMDHSADFHPEIFREADPTMRSIASTDLSDRTIRDKIDPLINAADAILTSANFGQETSLNAARQLRLAWRRSEFKDLVAPVLLQHAAFKVLQQEAKNHLMLIEKDKIPFPTAVRILKAHDEAFKNLFSPAAQVVNRIFERYSKGEFNPRSIGIMPLYEALDLVFSVWNDAEDLGLGPVKEKAQEVWENMAKSNSFPHRFVAALLVLKYFQIPESIKFPATESSSQEFIYPSSAKSKKSEQVKQFRAWAEDHRGQSVNESQKELGREFGLSWATVAKILLDGNYGIKTGVRRRKSENVKKFKAWAKEHRGEEIKETQAQLGKRFGINPSTANKILQDDQYNIKTGVGINRESEKATRFKAWAEDHRGQTVDETQVRLAKEFTLSANVINQVLSRGQYNIVTGGGTRESEGGKKFRVWADEHRGQEVKETQGELGQRFGLTMETINKLLSTGKYGIKTGVRSHESEKVKQLKTWAEGHRGQTVSETRVDLANRFGLALGTVNKILSPNEGYGVRTTKVIWASDEAKKLKEWAEAHRDQEVPETQPQLAESFRLTQRTVKKILSEGNYGITLSIVSRESEKTKRFKAWAEDHRGQSVQQNQLQLGQQFGLSQSVIGDILSAGQYGIKTIGRGGGRPESDKVKRLKAFLEENRDKKLPYTQAKLAEMFGVFRNTVNSALSTGNYNITTARSRRGTKRSEITAEVLIPVSSTTASEPVRPMPPTEESNTKQIGRPQSNKVEKLKVFLEENRGKKLPYTQAELAEMFDVHRNTVHNTLSAGNYNIEKVIGHRGSKKSEATIDRAMNGGIDLNINYMNWIISKDGKGVEMNVDSAMIERIRREGIDSLTPVIFRIMPIQSIWPIIGLEPPKTERHLVGV